MGEFVWYTEQAPGFRGNHDKWHGIPVERRHRWCWAQIDFPPIWLGTIPMMATYRAVLHGDYTTISHWTDVAAAFERVGFTAEDYLLLRMSLSREDLAKEVARGGGSDLVNDTYVGHGMQTYTLNPAGWAMWPELVRSGNTPKRAATAILGRGQSVFPDGALLNSKGAILMSTDD